MKSVTWPSILDGVFFKKSTDENQQFTQVFNEYQSLVRSVIFQIAGDVALNDLSQDAFVRIWKGLPQFRNDSDITSWIYRISTNVALDYLRERKRKPVEYNSDALDSAMDKSSIEDELSQRQLVQHALDMLSDEHRAVAVLSLIHERSINELSQILDISEGTVKSRLFYAKDQLRHFLRKDIL